MDDRDRLQRELNQIRAEIRAEMERHITALARLRIKEVRIESALRASAPVGTIGTVETSRGGAISAAKTQFGTLWQAHLHSRGMSIPEWVASKGRQAPALEMARSWVKRPGKGGRPPSRLWADRLAAEFEDPLLSDPSSWPNGIRD